MPRVILPTALFIRRDEPCLLLAELNLNAPGDRGRHRYQILIVVRDDRPAEFRIDLGPETEDEEFRVMGCVEQPKHVEVLHTVEQLQEIADYLRERRSGWTKQIEPPMDLVTGYYDHMEEMPLVLRHTSISGPLFTKVRN